MTVPDYVPPAGPPTQAVHTDLANLYQWQGLTQDQLNSLRVRLITSVIQIVIQAITGFFIPGGGLSGAVDQLQSWAEGVASGELLDDLITELFGTSSILSTIVGSVIPGLDASKIISGILSAVQIPGLDVSKIVSGIFGAGFIPGLDASKIITGTFAQSKVTNLPTDLASLSTDIQELIDTITEGITGLGTTGNLLADVLAALQNIPYLNILGNLGPINIGATTQAILDQFISGFVNVIDIGSSLADAFNVANIIGSGSFLGSSSWDILGIRNNNPMWDGMLPTSTATLPLTQVGAGTSPGEWLVVSSGQAVMGYKRLKEATSLGVISWLGGGNTNISNFRVNIYRVDSTTGLRTLVHQSANIVGDLSADDVNADDWHTYVIDPPIAAEATEVYGGEFEVRAGSGVHYVVSQKVWLKDHPSVFPKRMCSIRNSGGSAPPSTIDEDDIEYTDEIPWMEWAVETGPGSTYHAPQRYQYTEDQTVPIPNWATAVEAIVLGGGEAGQRGGSFVNQHGQGGAAGHWNTGTWFRGTHFGTGDAVVLDIGGGGSAGFTAGSAGGDGTFSRATLLGDTITGNGGSSTQTVGAVSNIFGRTPGNTSYNGNTYSGGAAATTVGSPGNNYGGGGAGGGQGGGAAGAGAQGTIWLRFVQY